MFFRFGTKTVEKLVHRGEFHCRECFQQSHYQLVRREEYYHVFGIPILLRAHLATHLICENCRAEYDESAAGFSGPGPQADDWSCPQCGRRQKASYVRCPFCKVRRDGTPA